MFKSVEHIFVLLVDFGNKTMFQNCVDPSAMVRLAYLYVHSKHERDDADA